MSSDWLDSIRTFTRYALEDGYTLEQLRRAVEEEHERLYERLTPAATAIWTRDLAVAAVQRFVAAHGRPPTYNGDASTANRLPAPRTVRRLFGSWNGLIVAAGFEVSQGGRDAGVYDRTEAA